MKTGSSARSAGQSGKVKRKMSNELTTTENTDIITFDDSKVQLIKRTVAIGATDDELELFLHQCQKTGLDPLAKQIYFQKYSTKAGPKMSIITGIDGYRLVADRTGKYAGNDEAVFDGKISQTRYQTTFDAPAKASVTVWKLVSGQRVAFSNSAYWNEYYPGDKKGSMWQKFPHVMLAKCAESGALRKAFPADLSGVYTQEEMSQADVPIDIVTGEIAEPEPTPTTKPAETTFEELTPHPKSAVAMVEKELDKMVKEVLDENISGAYGHDYEPEKPSYTNEELRQQVAESDPVKAGFVADRLVLTGLYNVRQHAISAMKLWPELGEKALLYKTVLKTETAVSIFDWCVERKET